RAIFRKLLGTAGGFGSSATSAVGAFVHLAARTKIANLRILRRAEWAGVKAITATDAQILVMQHDAIFRRIDAGDRTDGGTWRIGAVHAGHRHRPLAGSSGIDGHDAAAIDAAWHLAVDLAAADADVALDAAVR